ncbi:MAG: DNA-3-methyladenine glycosylase [Paludibacteraceae bacterium]|nr:DNA-3-methyladenine glycosylase [Paludibacteraceae bacterium]
MKRLTNTFFQREALDIAPLLLGKKLIRVIEGVKREYLITEVEVYLGEEDAACHASKGRTDRTEVMYAEGGLIYVYLIYGMYWMLNFVTGKENHPQAILIRALENINGPGRVGKVLHLDKSLYGEDLATSNRIWIEDKLQKVDFTTAPRIGIDYASEVWRNKLWRFTIK